MNTPNESNTQTDVTDVLEKMGEIVEKSAGGNYIYRGESKIYDKVSSSLYREYAVDMKAEDLDMAVLQAEILKAVKAYTHKDNDFESLTELQYYGGKTNLIDFTTDSRVALFFACDGTPDQPGRVILLQKQSETYEVLSVPGTIPRASVHKSICVQSPSGVVEPDTVVCIPADLKAAMLDHLRKHHDISTETLYQHRRIQESGDTEFYKGLTFQVRADSAETVLEREKWYKEAIEHYTAAIDLNPENARAYTNRGLAYAKQRNATAALADYSKAIALGLEDARVYNNRGGAYRKIGDFAAAFADYNTAIALAPEDAWFYCNRGVAYRDIGDFAAAFADFNTAIALAPEDAWFYNNRGDAYRETGDFGAALADYSKAIALAPEDAGAYCNRGAAGLHLKAWQKAKADLTTAKDMGIDIGASFQNDYESVEDFETKNKVKVPEDIAALFQAK